MKSEKNILIAFLLNITFSFIELIGGIFTNSVAIISDAVHDFGDAISIAISFLLEKISKKHPDQFYTYGYARYSILGAFITTTILIIGSIAVIYGAILRILHPVEIEANGMIVFALFGVVINFFAAYFTREGDSLNQHAVNLHMLEDVLGWAVVLIGSILIKWTGITIIDSIMSLFVALFILVNACKNFKSIVDLFLEKTPNSIHVEELEKKILKIPNVLDVHHIHIWSLDGCHHYATMHIVTEYDEEKVKHEIREELEEYGIFHVTIEIEKEISECREKYCDIEKYDSIHFHTHHH